MTEENTQATTFDQTMANVFDKINTESTAEAPKEEVTEAVDETKPTEVDNIVSERDEKDAEVVTEKKPVVLEAPKSWSDEQKALWNEVPDHVKDIIINREKAYFKKIREQGNENKTAQQEVGFSRAIKTRLEPYKEVMAKQGMDESSAINWLLDMNELSEKNPVEFMSRYIKNLGIDANQLFQAVLSHSQSQAPYDPALERMKREFDELKNGMQEQFMGGLASEIDAFSADKPYFEDVKPLMAALLQSGQADELKDAYDMAVRAHPEIYERIQSDQRKREDEKRRKEAEQKALSAKKVAGINVKSSKGGSPKGKTIDETMNAVFAKLKTA